MDGTDERCFMETIQDEQTKIKVVSWPTPQDYNEAVQNLEHSMLDPELRSGAPELNALGLPKPNSGSFASVYKISVGTNDWALRCFLHNRPDQYERYKILQAFLGSVQPLDCLVSFNYLENGINVNGRVVPVLKMKWADGVQLTEYIQANLNSAEHLSALRDAFKMHIQSLNSCGIAHGDLQHGNILVLEDKLKFVDYDGMYVPPLENAASLELGHRNFQHPKRTGAHFGAWLDNFPSWVIYCSLTCLIYDANLWNKFEAGDECLLFRAEDYAQPLDSPAFYELETHHDERIRSAAKFLRSLIDYEMEDIPYLDDLPIYVRDLPALRPPLPTSSPAPTGLDVGMPIVASDWAASGSANPAFLPIGKPLSNAAFSVMVVVSFLLVTGVFLYVNVLNALKAPLEAAKVCRERSAYVVLKVYEDASTKRIHDVAETSLGLLERGSLAKLSEYNYGLKKEISDFESNKKDFNLHELEQLNAIYEANAKAIDATINASL